MEFEDGEIVVLNSGGPKMTVRFTEEDTEQGLFRDARDGVVWCEWFDVHGHRCVEGFYVESLRRAE